MRKSKKVMAAIFSAIPGAGHMYIGLQKQGLQYMSSFFFVIFFASWMDIGFLMFIIPIIWFYSFFDILKKCSMDEPATDDDIVFVAWLGKNNNWLKEKNKLIGYILVGIGVILIVEKIILPEISWEYRNYIETGALALAFIYGGLKLLLGNKPETKINLGDEN